jgi:antitoxin component of MazEF toxin-antitoxin module
MRIPCRLVKTGVSSLGVNVPADLVVKLGLNHGDYITVELPGRVPAVNEASPKRARAHC